MKVFIVGLAIMAAAVGGGVGYTALKTGQPLTIDPLSRNELSRNEGPDTDTSVSVLNGDVLNGGTEPFENEHARKGESGGAGARNTKPVEIESGDIVITEGELNQLVTDAIASQPNTAAILNVAKGINTTLGNGRIESSMTVNISELPLSELPPEAQDAVEQITSTFPFLANRDVYLGIEGRPTVTDGNISLTDAHIKFGQLKLPVSSIAGQIGISQADIEQQLNAVLAQRDLTPTSIEVIDQQIIIKGL